VRYPKPRRTRRYRRRPPQQARAARRARRQNCWVKLARGMMSGLTALQRQWWCIDEQGKMPDVLPDVRIVPGMYYYSGPGKSALLRKWMREFEEKGTPAKLSKLASRNFGE